MDTQHAPAVSVLLSDSSRMQCELLGSQLARREQPSFRVVGNAADINELLELARTSPELTIISGELRDGPFTGFEALRKLQAEHPKMHKVMLLDCCDRDMVLAAFRGGAKGVFCRSGSIDGFVKCLERVHQGQIWAGNTELQFVLDALRSIAPLRAPSLKNVLSRREAQMAVLLATGHNNREIGRKLNLSEQAVIDGVSRIYERTGILSRVELAMAVREQWQEITADAQVNPRCADTTVRARRSQEQERRFNKGSSA